MEQVLHISTKFWEGKWSIKGSSDVRILDLYSSLSKSYMEYFLKRKYSVIGFYI